VRGTIHEAIVGAREIVDRTLEGAGADDELTDDQLLARYEVHRGNPPALFDFVRTSTGLGGPEAVEAAVEYEREMEALVKSRGGV
jgi:hypothetical protein